MGLTWRAYECEKKKAVKIWPNGKILELTIVCNKRPENRTRGWLWTWRQTSFSAKSKIAKIATGKPNGLEGPKKIWGGSVDQA